MEFALEKPKFETTRSWTHSSHDVPEIKNQYHLAESAA